MSQSLSLTSWIRPRVDDRDCFLRLEEFLSIVVPVGVSLGGGRQWGIPLQSDTTDPHEREGPDGLFLTLDPALRIQSLRELVQDRPHWQLFMACAMRLRLGAPCGRDFGGYCVRSRASRSDKWTLIAWLCVTRLKVVSIQLMLRGPLWNPMFPIPAFREFEQENLALVLESVMALAQRFGADFDHVSVSGGQYSKMRYAGFIRKHLSRLPNTEFEGLEDPS